MCFRNKFDYFRKNIIFRNTQERKTNSGKFSDWQRTKQATKHLLLRTGHLVIQILFALQDFIRLPMDLDMEKFSTLILDTSRQMAVTVAAKVTTGRCVWKTECLLTIVAGMVSQRSVATHVPKDMNLFR